MTDDLFGSAEPELDVMAAPRADAPLADRMRPRSIDEYIGQEHLVGPGKVLERVLRGELVQSLILWGPPGTGKTTLARLIASKSNLRFATYSAVLSGIKEIREVMRDAEAERRRSGRRTLLFVDEIHRFNKAQQDAFLPYVEKGDIVLIGATTENPSFEINGALLSRMRTVILQPLRPEVLVRVLQSALDECERGLAGRVRASDAILLRIAHASDGDARRALTVLETAAGLVGSDGEIDARTLQEALQKKVLRHDKTGEEHYNLISALHKSVRNGDDSAALYWVARMMEAGEDGEYIGRRLIRMASEDIGLADPQALRVALDADEAFRKVGYPEGKIFLAQAAVYLARAPKSNAVYVALERVVHDVESTQAEPVPLHLRNAATGLMKAAGYGAGYRYLHDDPSAKDEMTCLPPSLSGRDYFAESTDDAQRPASEKR
ncbi:MAG: replication-associated recombination protein A [Planctomycetota bacterium]